MKIKLIAFVFLITIFSCNTNNNKANQSSNKEINPSESVDVQKKKLNDQSLACISLMNSLELDLNSAQASHDLKTTLAIQKRIDSAAEENSKIGQKLMVLENK